MEEGEPDVDQWRTDLSSTERMVCSCPEPPRATTLKIGACLLPWPDQGLAQQGSLVFEKLFSLSRRKLCLLDLASSAKARIHSRKQEAEAAQLLY